MCIYIFSFFFVVKNSFLYSYLYICSMRELSSVILDNLDMMLSKMKFSNVFFIVRIQQAAKSTS